MEVNSNVTGSFASWYLGLIVDESSKDVDEQNF